MTFARSRNAVFPTWKPSGDDVMTRYPPMPLTANMDSYSTNTLSQRSQLFREDRDRTTKATRPIRRARQTLDHWERKISSSARFVAPSGKNIRHLFTNTSPQGAHQSNTVTDGDCSGALITTPPTGQTFHTMSAS